MRNFSSISFSLQERVKTRENERSRKRETKSLLDSKKQKKKQKFCSKNKFRSIKNSKKQQTNFHRQRENNEKILRREKSVGKELDSITLLCFDLLTKLT